MIEIKNEESESPAKILVVGVGGAGNNAVNRMIEANISGVEYVGVNTDKQALASCKAPVHIQIGAKATQGLGAGANPEVGEAAAIESTDELEKVLEKKNMVFITAGMGGGTGTGATPVIAQIAKEKGALTVAVVTKPFTFEQKKRMDNALWGIDKLKDNVDTMMVIPNDKLLSLVDRRASFNDAIKKADEVLQQAVQGITDLITIESLINLDFADIQTVMKDKGVAHVGIGIGSGDNKAEDAVKAAVESKLLETQIDNASDIILNITGDISLFDANTAAEYIKDITGDNVNVIFGAREDRSEEMKDTCKVTVIATGIELPSQPMNRIVGASDYKPSSRPRTNTFAPQTTSGATRSLAGTIPVKPIEEPEPVSPEPIVERPVKPGTGSANIPPFSGGKFRSNVESKSYDLPEFMKRSMKRSDE